MDNKEVASAKKIFDLKFGPRFAQELPTTSAVYRIYDSADQLIYIGKAKNLRRRLSQYRNAKRLKKHRKMKILVQESARIDFEICSSELEAAVLEAQLIQKHRPKWNVAGAFFFMYPMVGFRWDREAMHVCYTTQPELFKGFEFHGAFRSREITGEAFFAWVRLLGYVGHRIKASRTHPVRAERYSFVFRFRQIPRELILPWSLFWRGESRSALEQLILLMVENAAARRAHAKIQEDLNTLNRFWRHEAKLLARVRAKTGYLAYPVSQKDRDLLFVKNRYDKIT